MDSAKLERLARTWRERVHGRTERTALAVVLGGLLLAAHLARLGTPAARLGAGALIGATTLAWLATSVLNRRGWRRTADIVRRTILKTDRALGERTLRAARLAERTAQDRSVGSAELARVHLDRLVSQASERALETTANRVARRWRIGGRLVTAAVVLVCAAAPTRVIEGFDVLVARARRAPVPLLWVEDTEVRLHPPPYLRQQEELVTLGSVVEVPAGSTLVFRGFPRRRNPGLVLSDGRREVAFDDDGSAGVTATWQVATHARLSIAARFGDVLIEEPEALEVRVVTDALPKVLLHDVPRTVRFDGRARQELRYSAEDDHGLTQIDLVLRSGDREERRALAHLDGTSRSESGATALVAEDTFLKRALLPVVVTIEARDNDGSKGAQWGKSESLVVALPAIGAPEAQRFEALSRAMTPLLRVLAAALTPRSATDAPSSEPKIPLTPRTLAEATRELETALAGTYLGSDVSQGLSAFFHGQIRRLKRIEGAAPVRLRTLELVVLSLDAALQILAERDAVAVSHELAELAEEAASGAEQARTTEREEFGVARSRAAALALGEGARELSRLGNLGADVGAVALADLTRLTRAQRERNMLHTELIARHVAARLRSADASFSGGGTGAVESGRSGTTETSSRASDTSAKFDQNVLELEQLIEEHRGNMATVEETVSEARRAVNELGWQAEAGRLARALRDEAANLPRLAAEPGAEHEAAFAREHAEAMADALEELTLEDALASGHDAKRALEAAERELGRLGDTSSDDVRAVKAAQKTVTEAVRWAMARRQAADTLAAEKAKGALRDAAARETDLAGKAGHLADRGARDEARLPEPSVRALRRARALMDQATSALSQSQAGQALGLQRQAQATLEQAATGRTTDAADSGRAETPERRGSVGKGGMRTQGTVAKPASLDDAARFRERVLRGLGRPGSALLAPAVRRYAEELLK